MEINTKGPIIKTRYLDKNELTGLTKKMYFNYYTSPGIILKNLRKFNNLNDIRRIFTGLISVIKRLFYYKK